MPDGMPFCRTIPIEPPGMKPDGSSASCQRLILIHELGVLDKLISRSENSVSMELVERPL